MTTPEQYASQYANLYSWLYNPDGDDVYAATPIRNYLQNNLNDPSTKAQALRAQAAKGTFNTKLSAFLASEKIKASGPTFDIEGDVYHRLSFQRVFDGKGSPSEIQDVLWLATMIGAVRIQDVPRYCSENLGVDCGGFVANYWGFGRPSTTNLAPFGSTGVLPRDFWGRKPAEQRKRPDAIKQGDAIIFFEGKFTGKDGNDPNTRAPLGAKGYDTTLGTKAFHIGLVAEVGATPTSISTLKVAESSGSPSMYAGNGVNVHPASAGTTIVGSGFVSYKTSATNRVFFVGPGASISPYLSQYE